MNDSPSRSDNDLIKAEHELARLNSRVRAMRAVLVQLLQDVVRADTLLETHRAAELLEANQQLVVSAVDALTEADTANGALDEAARVGGLDPLTGLPNRALLLDRFETAMAHAKRYGKRVALLFLDLDAFKQVNDTFGHGTGDEALQMVAGCLTSLVREADTVSRHGGDEFLILLGDVAQASDAALVADKVNAALAAHGHVGGHSIKLAASIGVSVYPEDGTDAKTLISRADAAMYVAKKEAKGRVVFHGDASTGAPSEPSMAAHALARRSIPIEPMAAEYRQQHEQLKEANEHLVLAALGAQELLAAAEEAKRRRSELLALVVTELNDPYAPIRLAATTLGIAGADKTLLPRVQAIIDQQVDKMARMVGALLDDRSVGTAQPPVDEMAGGNR